MYVWCVRILRTRDSRINRMCKVIETTVDNRKIRVAEIKEKYMQNIADAAKECDYIDKVVLFGSSLESRCKEDSDIDLAVFGNVCTSRCFKSMKYRRFVRRLSMFDNLLQRYDILYFKTGSKDRSPILKDIDKGEVVYERN